MSVYHFKKKLKNETVQYGKSAENFSANNTSAAKSNM